MAVTPPPAGAPDAQAAAEPEPEKRARSALLVASGVSVLGIAAAGTFSRTLGGVLLCAGWLFFAYALHSFGRAGSERA
jgi:hypothetical protein